MGALQGIALIADAHGLKTEVKGGGKRRHAVVLWCHGARVPRSDDNRLQRAINMAGGGGGVAGRALHSFTSQVNVSAFCGTGGAFRGGQGGLRGRLRGGI